MPSGNPGMPRLMMRRRFCGSGHDTHICGRSPNRQCNICRAAENTKERDSQVPTAVLEQRRVWRRKWYEKNIVRTQNDAWRKQGIKNKDGSDFQNTDYIMAWAIADGRCQICRIKNDELKKKLFADHDHVSGIFRGLLCNNCNLAIGNVKENKDILKSAISYIEAFAKETV